MSKLHPFLSILSTSPKHSVSPRSIKPIDLLHRYSQSSPRLQLQQTAAMSINQFQAVQKGGPFRLVQAPLPKPGPNEVCIRPKVVAINAIDYKNLKFGATVSEWPNVLGIEGAGTVESVGQGVTRFKAGDEVFTWLQRSQYNGAFQDVFTANESTVAKKPASLSFEEAASLGITFLTGAATVAAGLRIPLSGFAAKSTDYTSTPPQSILVLGGSSGVGAVAIQLLRAALPSATIISTSSAQHHAHLKSLGATTTLERSAQDNAATIKAATPGGAGVDAIIDAVGAAAKAAAVYDAFKSDGLKLYTLVITGPGVEPPKGFEVSLVGGITVLKKEPTIMQYLTELLESGKYKLPQKVEVVGQGWESVEKGLDKVSSVSGTKLVVKL
ncbi:putative quinone oxidoreductase [Bombardia bombarda]|uniref:Quinone oxidoreductase n=1 Tax=Bombardia bombarda TaxID=252184 RepID=A0AA39XN19_9PEZI|nr:putative quinone oxidoreductase [Bombardia bombarda]